MDLEQYSAEELDRARLFDPNLGCYNSAFKYWLQEFKDCYPTLKTYGRPKTLQLEVLILNLYVCWYHDRNQPLAIAKTRNKHKKDSRYNKRITSTITDVINDFLVGKLVSEKVGYSNTFTGKSRLTRILATDYLGDNWFTEVPFQIFDIRPYELDEPIVMKDEKFVDVMETVSIEPLIEFVDGVEIITDRYRQVPTGKQKKVKSIIDYKDTKLSKQWREELKKYNQLLAVTPIDIGNLKEPYIDREPPKKDPTRQPTRIHIDSTNKYVKRVFNRESFDYGGRFYGGWWQQIPKDLRQHIRIGSERTIEIDYSGFHVALLYAKENISYYDKYGTQADPYDVHVPEVNDPDYRRWLIKQVMLTAVNAESVEKMCKAVQFADTPDDIDRPEGLSLTNELLIGILDKLRDKHQPIAKHLCTGAGIELQNTDSKITAYLINKYTEEGICLLPVHDSYIVEEKYSGLLHRDMQDAVHNTLLEDGIDLTQVEVNLPQAEEPLNEQPHIKAKQLGYVDELFDDEEEGGGEEHQEMIKIKHQHLTWCPEYVDRLNEFNYWLRNRKG